MNARSRDGLSPWREAWYYLLMVLVLLGVGGYYLHVWHVRREAAAREALRMAQEQQDRELKRREENLSRTEERLARERAAAERKKGEERSRTKGSSGVAEKGRTPSALLPDPKMSSVALDTSRGVRRNFNDSAEAFKAFAGFDGQHKTYVDLWKNCPTDERPDAARGEMVYKVLLFFIERNEWCTDAFKVTADKGTAVKAVRRWFWTDGHEAEEDTGAYRKKMSSSVALIQIGRVWYLANQNSIFMSRRKMTARELYRESTVANVYYQNLDAFLRNVGVELPEIRLSFSFDPHDDDGTKPFVVAELSSRDSLAYDTIVPPIKRYLERKARKDFEESRTGPSVRKRPRAVFAPAGKLVPNTSKTIDGTVVVSREFHGKFIGTGYAEWRRWYKVAEELEQKSIEHIADEPRTRANAPRKVTDDVVRKALETGSLSWRLR